MAQHDLPVNAHHRAGGDVAWDNQQPPHAPAREVSHPPKPQILTRDRATERLTEPQNRMKPGRPRAVLRPVISSPFGGGSHGILMTCRGKIRSGLVICGLAGSRAPSVTPKNCPAMPLRVSPGWTV